MKTQPRALRGALAGVCAFTMLGLAGPAVYAEDAKADVDSVWINTAMATPGEKIKIWAQTKPNVEVNFTVSNLGATKAKAKDRANSKGIAVIEFTVPSADGRGYLVDAEAGRRHAYTGIDASKSWTRYPRMGYVGDYSSSVSSQAQLGTMGELAQKYHINSVQFYDWMWRHDDPVKTENGQVADRWQDWLHRPVEKSVVQGFIQSAETNRIASLPYSMAYAALNDDYEQHGVQKSWLINRTQPNDKGQMETKPYTEVMFIYKENGVEKWRSEEHVVDVGDAAWRNLIVPRFNDQIIKLGFKGTHIDQLGSGAQTTFTNSRGEVIDLPWGFAQLVNDTAKATGKPVGLNAVDGFGASELAKSNASYLYTELWGAHETNAQVKQYLQQQRIDSQGKPAIIAAYMNKGENIDDGKGKQTFNTASVQLADAAFAANGATHLELGQNGDPQVKPGNYTKMLEGPYFPDRNRYMQEDLKYWLPSYYNVITAYEQVLYGPQLTSTGRTVSIEGQPTSTDGAANTIWTNTMRNSTGDVLHLINLKGDDGKWRNATGKIEEQKNLKVKYYVGQDGVPARINLVSPDINGGAAKDLSFTKGTDAKGTYITFTVSSLKVWDFIYMIKGNGEGANTRVVNANSGLCMNVRDGKLANGTQVEQVNCDANSYSQNFQYVDGQLRLAGKNLCVDIKEHRNVDGAGIHTWECNSALKSQKWEYTSAGQYRNPETGKCLGVSGDSKQTGAPVHLWTCHSGASQRWTNPN